MRRVLAAIGLILGLGIAAPALAALTFPPLTGRVVDDAHILSPQTESDLTAKLADLEAQTGRQLVVVTLPSLQGDEIEDYGYQLGRAWGIGDAKADTGALFIVAPNEHKTRIEVGYGLEPDLTDALSSVILNTAVLPKFKAGDMEGGVVAGTDAIIQQLSLPDDQAKAQVAQATSQQASGGSSRGGVPVFLILIVIFFVISALRRGRGGGGMGGVLPGLIIGSALGSGRGGWGGGGGGGFGGGGGGFSGGGGSFGGGGASGGW